MNSEAEKGQAAGPRSWPRGRSGEHSPARSGRANLKVWNLKMTSSAFSNQSGGPNSEGGLWWRLSNWLSCSGGWRAAEARRRAAERLRPAVFTTLYIGGGFDTNWKQNLFCHKRLRITRRESEYGCVSTDRGIHEDDGQHERRHEWRDEKNKVKKLDTGLSPVLCINTWDWIVFGVVRQVLAVCNLPGFGRALLYVGANFLACALTRFS